MRRLGQGPTGLGQEKEYTVIRPSLGRFIKTRVNVMSNASQTHLSRVTADVLETQVEVLTATIQTLMGPRYDGTRYSLEYGPTQGVRLMRSRAGANRKLMDVFGCGYVENRTLYFLITAYTKGAMQATKGLEK